jgi:replicative DNA helicase
MTTATVQRQQSAALAERELILSLFANPGEVPEVRDQVREDDFHCAAYQRAYAAALRLFDRRQPIDAAGLLEELRSSGDLEDVPKDLFIDIAQRHGGTMVQVYAERVLSLSLSRGLAHAIEETAAEIENPTGPPDELLDRAQARLDRLAARSSGAAAVPVDEVANQVLNDIDARRRGERAAGLASGFARLDEDLGGGFPLGHLITMGARPSVGKTAFALNIARNVCHRGGAVLFVSLEQPRKELTERMYASEANVNGQRIRTGKLDRDEQKRISQAADVVRPWGWRFQINDQPGLTAAQIASAARRARRKAKALDLIIVDYLQLVGSDNPKANRNEQVGASTRRLRDMARELGVPVLLLCQLSRAAEETEVPRLHHLRDSGEIEQHSDVVLFLHRAQAREPGRADIIDLHVAKQRNGPLSAIRFEHTAWTFTFAEDGIPR